MTTNLSIRFKTVQIGTISVEIALPPERTIWLDTSLFFMWAQIQAGKQSDPDRRLHRLMEAIHMAVDGGQVAVVEGFQFEESTRNPQVMRAALNRLCRGWAIFGQRELEAEEWRGLMTAWMAGTTNAFIRAASYIKQSRPNPVVEGYEDVANRNKQQLERRRKIARNAEQVHIDVRQESRSFEQQYREEHDGYWRGIRRRYRLSAQAWEEGAATPDDAEWLGHAEDLFRLYRSVGGVGDPIDGLTAFFESPYGRAIPSHHVRATHWAHWMTIGCERQVKSGDPSDNEHLQYALPYLDVVVCDNENRLMVTQRGLDTQFGVEVFSLQTIEELTTLISGSSYSHGAQCG